MVMQVALIIMVNKNAEKDDGIDESPSASQVPENKLRHNFRLGDITWVKLGGSSWWPAQVCVMTLHLVSISFSAESMPPPPSLLVTGALGKRLDWYWQMSMWLTAHWN